MTRLDPMGTSLVYSNRICGNGSEEGLDIAVDATGAAYVVGDMDSTDFTVTAGALQTVPGASFALKQNPSGTHLDYATYLGPPDWSVIAWAVRVDNRGRAVVAGTTFGVVGFITPGALKTVFGPPTASAPLCS